MRDHLHDLWEDLDLPEAYPTVDPRAVRRRVDAVLDGAKGRGPRRPLRVALSGLLLAAAGITASISIALADTGQALPPIVSDPPAVSPTPTLPPDGHGWSIIITPEDYDSGNPTRDRTDEISALPVYPSGPLSAEAQQAAAEDLADALDTTLRGTDGPGVFLLADGTQLSFSADAPEVVIEPTDCSPADLLSRLTGGGAVETAKSVHYSFSGEPDTQSRSFPADTGQPLEEQLLDYTFSAARSDSATSLRLTLTPVQQGVYPIRSTEEALSLFRAGNYFGVETRPEEARVLWVQLIYRTDGIGSSFLQPFYEIIYMQAYWDLTPVMHTEKVRRYSSISSAYVPAVTDPYLDELRPTWYINDTDTGHGIYAPS